MKRILSFILSMLMVITALSGALVGLNVAAEGAASAIDLINADLWSKNEASQYMAVSETTEDYGPAYEISERADGSKVVQMMINHQQLESVDGRSYGMLAMFYFGNDGKTVKLEYFSTVNGMYYMDKFQYEIELDLID
ncbi:MAG: hypothetical protein J6C29_02880 [Clostridia bacterium]|nr:hypothetical protein [Clostridia bacterium]